MISSRFSKPGKENDISSSPLHYNNSTPSERISADVLGPTGTYQVTSIREKNNCVQRTKVKILLNIFFF